MRYIGIVTASLIFFGMVVFIFFLSAPSGTIFDGKWKVFSDGREGEISIPVKFEKRGMINAVLVKEFGKVDGNILFFTDFIAQQVNVKINGIPVGVFSTFDEYPKVYEIYDPQLIVFDPGILKEKNIMELEVISRNYFSIGKAPYLETTEMGTRKSSLMNVVVNDILTVAVGMGLILSLILILLGTKMSDKRTAYAALGFSVLLNSISYISFFIVPEPGTDIIRNFFYNISPIYNILASYFSLVGIEYFLKGSLKLSTRLLIPNIIGCAVVLVGLMHLGYSACLLNFILMIWITVKSKDQSFTFASIFLSLTVFYQFFTPLFPMLPNYSLIGYGSISLFISFSLVLVKEYRKNFTEIQAKSNELYASYEELTAMNEELQSSYTELDLRVEERTRDLNKAMNSVKTLLNNTDEGFLSFGENLIIEDEYSKECERIFGKHVEHLDFSNLLYPDEGKNDIEMRNFLKALFPKILLESSQQSREMYMSLLPEEVLIKGRNINIEYRIVEEKLNDLTRKKIMLILKDITEKRILEGEIERERNILKMVVKVLLNRDDFIDAIKEFRNFVNKDLEYILESPRPNEQKIAEIFRQIHTYKGTFANFGGIAIVSRLHDFESVILEYKEKLSKSPKLELSNFFKRFKIFEWLDEDLNILKKNVSQDFFEQETPLKIEPERIIEIENKILSQIPYSESKQLLQDLRKLRYRPIKDLLMFFPDYIDGLAQRAGKYIDKAQIEGEHILVDKDIYKEFMRSLNHVFRNSIDHGIETMEERLSKGKLEYGTIKIIVESEGSNIILSISDDGGGIDFDKVKAKAVSLNMLSREEAEVLSEEEIIKFIFMDNFSTKDEATELSGRGTGLAALKSEVEKMNGTIEVFTEKDVHTTFKFTIPVQEFDEFDELSAGDIMKPLINKTKEYLKSVDIPSEGPENFNKEVDTVLKLRNVTSFIKIRGIISATFIFSGDTKLVQELTKKFSFTDISPQDLDVSMEDCIAEMSNIILGNCVNECGGDRELIAFGSPVTFRCEKGAIKYFDSELWNCEFKTKFGKMTISLINNKAI